ncbi:Phage-related baseplate assembly protein [Planctomycetes bacterium Pan216]|uniref:Phage-related baseplate assembly protein n=1 Tax=Kolteria novifilia TaxID=2527975 RepID=A0A518B122_9BACT|nr:Phage-related baseplate assembly protein [Planctomycetes bacterium Pan216]
MQIRLQIPGSDDPPMVHRLEGREAVSTPFEFVVDLCHARSKEREVLGLIGREVTLVIDVPDRSSIHVQGMIATVGGSFTGAGAASRIDAKYALYRATIVPRIFPLLKNSRFRIFQETTLEDLIEKTLGTTRPAIDFRDGTYPYKMATQYQESDWSHLQRRLEDNGCHYYFTFEETSPTIHFADTSRHAPLVEELLGRAHDRPTLIKWRQRQRLVPCRGTVGDLAHERHSPDLHADAVFSNPIGFAGRETRLDVPAARKIGLETREPFAQRFSRYSWDGEKDEAGLDGLEDLARQQASVRLQEHTVGALVAKGTSTSVHLRPGCAVEIDHGAGEPARYFITRARHSVTLPLPLAGLGDAEAYRCKFECLPIDLPYRVPTRTARPLIDGVETATVVGHARGEVTTNDELSVRVRFAWGSDADSESFWVRVLQPKSGQGFGNVWIPSDGQEVLVQFEQGDPDRPHVIGALYNERNRPAGDRSSHRSIDHMSFGSDRRDSPIASQIAIDKSPGKERIHFVSEKDLEWLAENDLWHVTGRDCKRVYGDSSAVDLSDSGSGCGGTSASAATRTYTLNVSGETTKTVSGDSSLSVTEEAHYAMKGASNWIADAGVEMGALLTNIVGPTWSEIAGWTFRLSMGGANALEYAPLFGALTGLPTFLPSVPGMAASTEMVVGLVDIELFSSPVLARYYRGTLFQMNGFTNIEVDVFLGTSMCHCSVNGIEVEKFDLHAGKSLAVLGSGTLKKRAACVSSDASQKIQV